MICCWLRFSSSALRLMDVHTNNKIFLFSLRSVVLITLISRTRRTNHFDRLNSIKLTMRFLYIILLAALASAYQMPRVIQGGMGIRISSWQLAREVSRKELALGVVSGTVLDTVFVRELQMGKLEYKPCVPAKESIIESFFLSHSHQHLLLSVHVSNINNDNVNANSPTSLYPFR